MSEVPPPLPPASVLSQRGQEVLVSQDFICQPVEDVEDQEAHWENGSGNGVDPLRPLHEAPAYFVEAQTRRQVGEHGRCVHLRCVSRQRESQTLEEQTLLCQLFLLKEADESE